MMKIFSVALMLFAFTAVTFGHGTEKHVMGVVTKITDTEITVQGRTRN